jgi:uncharacterized membrane protein YraQ (UPF0718 family)
VTRNQALRAAGLLIAWIGLYLSLPTLADALAYGIIGLEKDTRLGSAIVFFLYETPKVILLLTLVVFLVGIVRSFFSPEKTRSALEKRTLLSGNILASLLGIVTPFCSCSAVPLFIGFVEAGIPLGVTFSFLIAAPMINEVAVVLLFGLFGWRVALLYVGMGLMVAITAGYVMGKLKLERHVESWVLEVRTNAPCFDEL